VGKMVKEFFKHMCGGLQNSFMLLGLDFMLLNQIVNMSLNGLRRGVANCHKNLTMPLMEEPSVALDS
jgi:hypothetical protein